MKYFIVGDIHGCYDELNSALNNISLNKEQDTIIFVGDYFDRGLKSNEVWQLLKALKEEMGDRCILISGNHETMLVDFINGVDSSWRYNGYVATMDSVGKDNLKSLKEWVQDTTTLYYEGELFDVVHAGRMFESNLSEEDPDTLLWDRSLFRGRIYGGKLTFIGHTPVNAPVYISENSPCVLEYDTEYDLPITGVIDIDTGCVFGTCLTIAEVNTDTKKLILHREPFLQKKLYEQYHSIGGNGHVEELHNEVEKLAVAGEAQNEKGVL